MEINKTSLSYPGTFFLILYFQIGKILTVDWITIFQLRRALIINQFNVLSSSIPYAAWLCLCNTGAVKSIAHILLFLYGNYSLLQYFPWSIPSHFDIFYNTNSFFVSPDIAKFYYTASKIGSKFTNPDICQYSTTAVKSWIILNRHTQNIVFLPTSLLKFQFNVPKIT